ncbi:MAG: hypothetical protein GEU92_12520 [Alphaproteobacteria bacterium]|nr:hypothetical protein [Alphaproteobacteria bacterium]
MIETLSDACRARRLLWAFCLACGHAHRVDPRKVMLLAGELTLRDLQKRLKCERCRQKRGHVLPHDEEWDGR